MSTRLLAMNIVDSFRLFPAITVHIVCLDSSQGVYDFADLMVELFTKVEAKIYGYNNQQIFSFEKEANDAKAHILKAIQTNPALNKRVAYVGSHVKVYNKPDYSIKEIYTAINQVKAEGLLPQEVVILPITGANVCQKEFAEDTAFDLIQSLGDFDWQQGLPSIIVIITDADHNFLKRLQAQKMAQRHALFFGYDPLEPVIRIDCDAKLKDSWQIAKEALSEETKTPAPASSQKEDTLPSRIYLIGRGFVPSTEDIEQMKPTIADLYKKVASMLWASFFENVKIEVDKAANSDREEFVKTADWAKQCQLPDSYIETKFLFDNKTGRDLLCVIVWAGDSAKLAKDLFQPKHKTDRKGSFKGMYLSYACPLCGNPQNIEGNGQSILWIATKCITQGFALSSCTSCGQHFKIPAEIFADGVLALFAEVMNKPGDQLWTYVQTNYVLAQKQEQLLASEWYDKLLDANKAGPVNAVAMPASQTGECPVCSRRQDTYPMSFSYACPKCKCKISVNQEQIDPRLGVRVACWNCMNTLFVPPTVWCPKCHKNLLDYPELLRIIGEANGIGFEELRP
jgi:hypothetical protein